MVANAGMTLQALSLEMDYAPSEKRESLVRQHSAHFRNLLEEKVKVGEVSIPSDDWLTWQGFSPFYEERIAEISGAAKELDICTTVEERNELVALYSQNISTLLSDIANGPNALNLQTAVDMAKSSKGIDQQLHKFVTAIPFKRDAFRCSKDNPLIYSADHNPMPVNMEEPISWNVHNVNAFYAQANIELTQEKRLHEQFRNVLPGRAPASLTNSLEQTRKDYDKLVKAAIRNKGRLRQRRSADQQPTMHVRARSGKVLILQEISEDKGLLPIWRANGLQPTWKVTVTKNAHIKSARKRFSAKLAFVDEKGNQQVRDVGFVSPESAKEHNLESRLSDRSLSVTSQTITLQVPYAQQHDTDMLYTQAELCVQKALKPPSGQDLKAHRQHVFTEFWGSHYTGRKIVMRHGTDVLCDRLQNIDKISINKLQVPPEFAQQLVADSPHTIRFGDRCAFHTSKGISQASVSVMLPSGEWQVIGAVDGKSVELANGATYMAALTQPTGPRAVVMQAMELATVEQSKAEVEAFSEGRHHLTLDEEPYAVYGIKAGDIVVAQANEGDTQVALQVRDQHVIDEPLLARPEAAERWAIAEKSSPDLLEKRLTAASQEGKTLWGLNVHPLGLYMRGKVMPFEATVDVDPALTAQSSLLEKPMAQTLWEKYSSQSAGTVAFDEPQFQQTLDNGMARRAVRDGHSPGDVQRVIAQYSPGAKQSGQPKVYARNIVGKVVHAARQQRQKKSVSRSKSPLKKRVRKKEAGMEL